MKIYFASGFSIMNVSGKEKEIFELGVRHRLISFYDVGLGNNVFQVLELNDELAGRNRKVEMKNYDGILLIACSKRKSRHIEKGRARDIYQGTMFKTSLSYGEKNNLDVWILSAKYGFIRPDDIIESYDEKMTEYTGPWPDGEGWFVGGSNYFGNIPDRFKPLLKGRGVGDIGSLLAGAIKNNICLHKKGE